MEQFSVELISKIKKSIDCGISAKQSYVHVLWQGNYLEGFEVSKLLFTRETDVGFRFLLKIETTFLERVKSTSSFFISRCGLIPILQPYRALGTGKSEENEKKSTNINEKHKKTRTHIKSTLGRSEFLVP